MMKKKPNININVFYSFYIRYCFGIRYNDYTVTTHPHHNLYIYIYIIILRNQKLIIFI